MTDDLLMDSQKCVESMHKIISKRKANMKYYTIYLVQGIQLMDVIARNVPDSYVESIVEYLNKEIADNEEPKTSYVCQEEKTVTATFSSQIVNKAIPVKGERK